MSNLFDIGLVSMYQTFISFPFYNYIYVLALVLACVFIIKKIVW